jgi:putative lipoic acid-binding regulatory protein
MIEIEGKPEIEYPTEWKYKVIGLVENEMRKEIDEVFQTKEYSIRFSRQSKKGKFVSLEVSAIVETEEERNSIFGKLQNSKSVRMVI